MIIIDKLIEVRIRIQGDNPEKCSPICPFMGCRGDVCHLFGARITDYFRHRLCLKKLGTTGRKVQ